MNTPLLAVYLLLVTTPSGQIYQWGVFNNIYSCAGALIKERMAQDDVLKHHKGKWSTNYRFSCVKQK